MDEEVFEELGGEGHLLVGLADEARDGYLLVLLEGRQEGESLDSGHGACVDVPVIDGGRSKYGSGGVVCHGQVMRVEESVRVSCGC